MSASSEPVAPAAADGKPLPPVMIHPFSLLKRFWLLLLVGVILLGAGINWFRWAWQDQGYAPPQYIAFSHKQHVGDLKLDCQYCHSGVTRGRHAGVPPMETCLGCHKNVATDKPEIKKLLEVAEKGSYEENGVTKEGGVIHWNRVHRLPDHVYFTHEWHVKAGVACRTCHGPVEEMTTMRQFSDLTMGWCLDCHRKSNYVGGREYQAGKPETFTVGTGDAVAANQRQDPDPTVVWLERRLAGRDEPAMPAGHPPLDTHAAPTAHAAPTTVAEVEPRYADKLQKLLAQHPQWKDRPTWRIADLPESHRAIYGAERFQNAPVQCSTCHQ